MTSRILMVFEPKAEDVGKAFRVTGREPHDGRIDVVLEASDERVRRRMKEVVLTVAEADGALSRITYTDAEGDEVRFDLSQVVVNPDLPADAFSLKVPEGTRILRRTVKPEK